MKKLVLSALLTLSGTALAQPMPAPAQPAPGQPAPGAPVAPPANAHWVPQAVKGPDARGLADTAKRYHDDWSSLDAARVTMGWSFPAAVFTTDAQGNPVYVQVDEAALKGALAAAFAQVPKPAPGEPAAKIQWKGPKIEWVSNTLAVVGMEATLVQGKGKNLFRMQWKSTEIWTREASGWKVKGYTSSGWGDLLKH